MSRRRARILFAAVMSPALLAGLVVAESSSATTPDTVSESSETVSDTVGSSEVISDTVAESEVATTSGTIAETSVPTTPVAAAVEILPPDEPWGGVTLGEWDARSFQWWVSMPEDINPSLDVLGPRLRIRPVRTCLLPDAVVWRAGGVTCDDVRGR